MGLIITSETAKQYLLTEDAVEGLNMAVQNGQVRLALQIVVELVDGIMQVLDYIVQDEEDTATIPEPTKEEPKQKEQDPPKEKSETTAKKTTKTEPVDTQEV